MQLRQGVRVLGARPELLCALIVANDLWKKHGVDLVVTSVIDGTHIEGSKHYVGAAADLRVTGLKNPADVTNELRASLTDDYDVVLEGDHVHIELDVKKPY